ncbi:MAG: ATP-binding protein [Spirochaetaceae bacterium]
MIPRTLIQEIEKAKQVFPVISITGPRQSGKTTLVRSMFPGYHYLNLEALDIRALAEEDPRRFINSHIDRGLIIDEAQRVPALFSYLQTIVDETGEMGNVVLTGSQHFLAGRVMVLHLLPFTLLELPVVMKDPLDRVLFRGMYPPLHDRDMEASLFYPTYIQTYVERDVRLIKNIGDLSAFARFLRLCAGRTGSLLNMSSLAVEAGIDHKTVRSWISILEASFIVYLLQPYYRNYKKRIVKQPKLYFYDTGLLCSLLGLDDEKQLSSHYLRGGIFENFILSEFLKIKMHQGRRPHIYFWRDNTGTEVDLILEHGAGFSAVEIKSGTTLKDEYTKSLMKFADYSGCPAEERYVIYGGDLSYAGKKAGIYSWRDLLSLSHKLLPADTSG